MCLALPYKILSVSRPQATVSCPVGHDKNKTVGINLVPDLKKGDFVLVQNNLAVKKVPKKEAAEIFKMLK